MAFVSQVECVLDHIASIIRELRAEGLEDAARWLTAERDRLRRRAYQRIQQGDERVCSPLREGCLG